MKLGLGSLMLGAVLATGCADAPEQHAAAIDADAPKNGGYKLVEVANGFQMPWGFAMLADGSFLVSEREGFVSYVAAGTSDRQIVSGAPEAYVSGQGGILDIALDPDFENNRSVYISYSKGNQGENSTAVYKAQLSDDGLSLEDGADIYVAPSKRESSAHYGGRLMFLPDGTLMLSVGEGFIYMHEAQNTMTSHGKIVRINSDGSIPEDNPFADGKNGHPSVYSYGHRNVQGLAYDAKTDTIYAHEHGPKGGDEVNVIKPGLNYGWPVITYGVNYDGSVITTETEAPGMEQPIVKWVPSIAPSGVAFVTSDKYPEWQGDLLVTALADMKLQRVDLEDGRVVGETTYFKDFRQRLRHIAQGSDGYLYVLIDDLDAGIYRIEADT